MMRAKLQHAGPEDWMKPGIECLYHPAQGRMAGVRRLITSKPFMINDRWEIKLQGMEYSVPITAITLSLPLQALA